MDTIRIEIENDYKDIPYPVFNIGERLASKKTGLPTVGTVLGLVQGKIYALNAPTVRRWDVLFPDWRNKWVYTLYFPFVQRIASFDEFVEDMAEREGELFNSSDLDKYRLLYKYMVPCAGIIAYCEDDLERLD